MASGRGRYPPVDMVVACADQAVVYANRAQSGERLCWNAGSATHMKCNKQHHSGTEDIVGHRGFSVLARYVHGRCVRSGVDSSYPKATFQEEEEDPTHQGR
eukprot:scaffold6697_cov109-Skeletonema_dohrnii-CCMP3373.AAC.3